MDALLSHLSSLGPWGVVAALVVTVVIQYFRKTRPDLFPEPKPDAPKPDGEQFPILDAILKKILGGKFRGAKVAGVRELPPELLAALENEIREMKAAQVDDAYSKIEKLIPPLADEIDDAPPAEFTGTMPLR